MNGRAEPPVESHKRTGRSPGLGAPAYHDCMKQSAGTLLYREGSNGLEVLLVHPSGNYNRKKPWSIPKGEPDPGETDLEITARRETLEETGVTAGAARLAQSSTPRARRPFMRSPAPRLGMAPGCASWEVDQARFVPLTEARTLLHPEQVVFLDRLVEHLKK